MPIVPFNPTELWCRGMWSAAFFQTRNFPLGWLKGAAENTIGWLELEPEFPLIPYQPPHHYIFFFGNYRPKITTFNISNKSWNIIK